jgi:hypothetical protein
MKHKKPVTQIVWLAFVIMHLQACVTPQPTLIFAQPTLTSVPANLSPLIRQAEEYAVYRVVIPRQTCVFGETEPGSYINPDNPDDLPKLDPELINDYNSNRLDILPINPDTDLGDTVTVISVSQWEKFFEGVDYLEGWRHFDEGTDCSRIYWVSRVGFNAQMDQALIYFLYHYSLGGLESGEFGFMLLSKGIFGKWDVEDRFILGVM